MTHQNENRKRYGMPGFTDSLENIVRASVETLLAVQPALSRQEVRERYAALPDWQAIVDRMRWDDPGLRRRTP